MSRPQTSTRDVAATVAAFQQWIRARVSAAAEVEVTGAPTGAGLSSDTVLFDLVDAGKRRGYVLRLPPPEDAFPLFPWYDLGRQVAAMRLVAERSAVPVPRIPWYEPDPAPLGAPFFVMDRLDGFVAPDIPPYVFDGWMLELSTQQLERMEHGVVQAIAGIHAVALDDADAATFSLDEPGDTPLQRHVAHQRRYYDWIRKDGRFPLIEALFAWLEARWPDESEAPMLSWGDSRIANILFRDSDVVGVLDWEAVALGPRELDLGWLLYFHDYYQRIATRFGKPGLPGFLEPQRVIATYAAIAGHDVRDLDWYLAYAALRQGLTSIRVSERAVHFGERARPDDPDDLVMDRDCIEEILST